MDLQVFFNALIKRSDFIMKCSQRVYYQGYELYIKQQVENTYHIIKTFLYKERIMLTKVGDHSTLKRNLNFHL